jgi:hypothetical protein
MLEREALFRLPKFFISEFLFVVNSEGSEDGNAINIIRKFEIIRA